MKLISKVTFAKYVFLMISATANRDFHNNLRHLNELFRTTSSSVCRRDCIDAGHYFCPSRYDGYYGTCCAIGDDCPENDNICSTDAPEESIGLVYWSCPHSLNTCGMSTKTTSPDGYENIVSAENFSNGELCRYKFEFPQLAAEYDRLIIRARSVENAVIYAV